MYYSLTHFTTFSLYWSSILTFTSLCEIFFMMLWYTYSMNKIKNQATSTQIIKKSTFIGWVSSCGSKEECKEIVHSLWQQHPKATHICVAYVGNTQDEVWFDDDGEPAHSAGKVMLNVLLKQELLQCVACVIRYYGGIQLGVGGLVKAYTSSVSDTLKQAIIEPITYHPYLCFNVHFDYAFTLWESLKRKKYDLNVSVNDTDCSFVIQASIEDIHPYLALIPSTHISEVKENMKEV